MSRFVVDTNVPIVANGHPNPADTKSPSINCRIAAVRFLLRVLGSGTVLLDADGEIQKEYRRYLNPTGQPGVGDRFYQVVLHSAPGRVDRIDISRQSDGEYVDLPEDILASSFDRSDRKFAALARLTAAPVVNATDSDWLIHRVLLKAAGVQIQFLCGCDRASWFTS